MFVFWAQPENREVITESKGDKTSKYFHTKSQADHRVACFSLSQHVQNVRDLVDKVRTWVPRVQGYNKQVVRCHTGFNCVFVGVG